LTENAEFQRGLLDIWYNLYPYAEPALHVMDGAIGAISNVASNVASAVGNTIYNITQTLGGLINIQLGKRDTNGELIQLRSELITFLNQFKQLVKRIFEKLQKIMSSHNISSLQSFFNGNPDIQALQQLLQTHVTILEQLMSGINLNPWSRNADSQIIVSSKNALHVMKDSIESLRSALY